MPGSDALAAPIATPTPFAPTAVATPAGSWVPFTMQAGSIVSSAQWNSNTYALEIPIQQLYSALNGCSYTPGGAMANVNVGVGIAASVTSCSPNTGVGTTLSLAIDTTTWPSPMPSGQTLIGFGNSIIEQGNTSHCSGSTHALTTPPNAAGTCYFDLVAVALGFASSVDKGLGGSTLQHCTPGSDCTIASGIDRYTTDIIPYAGPNSWLIVDYTANDANLTGTGVPDYANFSPSNYQANLTTILKAMRTAGVPGSHMIVCDGSFVDPLYYVSANPWIFQYAAASANAVLAVPGARLADCYSAIALNGGVSLLYGAPGSTRIHPTDAGSPYIATAIEQANATFAAALSPVANFLASAATNNTIVNSLSQQTFGPIVGNPIYSRNGPPYQSFVTLASGWLGAEQTQSCGGIGLGGTTQIGFFDFGCQNPGAFTLYGSGGTLYLNEMHLADSAGTLNPLTFNTFATSGTTAIYAANSAGAAGVGRQCFALDDYSVRNLLALDCNGDVGVLGSVTSTEFLGRGAGLTGIPANQFASSSFTANECAYTPTATTIASTPCPGDTVTAPITSTGGISPTIGCATCVTAVTAGSNITVTPSGSSYAVALSANPSVTTLTASTSFSAPGFLIDTGTACGALGTTAVSSDAAANLGLELCSAASATKGLQFFVGSSSKAQVDASGNAWFVGSVGIGSTPGSSPTGVTWSTATSAPSGACTAGSIKTRTDSSAGSGSEMYVCRNVSGTGTWEPITGG